MPQMKQTPDVGVSEFLQHLPGTAFATPPITGGGVISGRGLCHLPGALNPPPGPLVIFQRTKIPIGSVRPGCTEEFSHGTSPGTTKSALYHPETKGRRP